MFVAQKRDDRLTVDPDSAPILANLRELALKVDATDVATAKLDQHKTNRLPDQVLAHF